MAVDTASYRIDLIDGTSDAAESAAASLAKLKDKIDADVKALSNLQKALANVNKSAKPNKDLVDRLTASQKALKERISANQAKFVDQGGSFRAAAKGGNAFKERLEALTKQAQLLPGPMGGVLSRVTGFLGAAKLSTLAAVGLAAGIVAVGAAALVAARQLAMFALESQNARRAELLQIEATTKLRTAYATAFKLPVDKASDVQNAIDEVSASVSISREKVAQYAMQLERSGVRGKNLKTALEAVSTAASGWGEEQANQTASWAAQLSLTGQGVDKLATRVKNQIGGVVKKQMLDLNVQAMKAKESQAALFAGINIEPLLKAKATFLSVFSQATNSGKVLKRWLSTITQPLIDGLTWAWTTLKNFTLDFVILLLRMEIKWLKLRLAFKQGGGEIGKTFHNIAKLTIRWAIDMFVKIEKAKWKLLGWLLKTLTKLSQMLVLGLVKLAVNIPNILANILLAAMEVVYDILSEIDWGKLGNEIIQGLIGGIKAYWENLKSTVKELGTTIADAFKNTLNIKSPSQVFADLGKQIPAGVSAGIKSGTPGAQRAAEDMIPVPAAQGGAGGRALGNTVTINTLQVTVGGDATTADAKRVAQSIKHELENILASVAVQMGAPVT